MRCQRVDLVEPASTSALGALVPSPFHRSGGRRKPRVEAGDCCTKLRGQCIAWSLDAGERQCVGHAIDRLGSHDRAVDELVAHLPYRPEVCGEIAAIYGRYVARLQWP